MNDADPTLPAKRRGDRLRLEAGYRVAGRYEILRVIGHGGMGTVFAAQDTLLHRAVAVKLVALRDHAGDDPDDATTRERFLREARASSRLRHPNVVAIHDAGVDARGLFLVFELVEGESLAQLMAREGPLAPARAAHVGAQVAAGLAAAHALGIVHRDIKPANILACPDGAMRVADFGIARLEGSSRLTATDIAMGTPGFMAPEQIEGSAAAAPADIFALGCVLYSMLAGHGPFDAESRDQVLARILAGRPDELPARVRREAPELAALVARMLQRRPQDRPASAAEVEALLLSPEIASAEPKRATRRAVAGVVALVIIAAAVGLTWRTMKRGETDGAISAPHATSTASTPPTPPPDPDVQEIVRLSKSTAVDLLTRLPQFKGVHVAASSDDAVTVSGPGPAVGNVKVLIGVSDALTGHDFTREKNLFNSGDHSSWRISFEAREMSLTDLVQTLSGATGWPTVQDMSLNGFSVTVAVKDAPWDLALRSLLDGMRIGTLRHGDIWIVGTHRRCEELSARSPPAFVVQRPVHAEPQALVTAVRAAGSPACAAAWDERLRAVIIVDRADRLRDIATAWAAVDGVAVGTLDFGDRLWRGEPLSVSLREASMHDLLRLMSEVGDLNVLVDPAVKRQELVSLDVRNARWDNLFDAVLLTRDLALEREANVARVFVAGGDEEVVSSVISLQHLPTSLFDNFSGSVAPGGLTTDPRSSTLVVRDTRARVAWFRRFAETVEDMASARAK